jgi:hypothetical protein
VAYFRLAHDSLESKNQTLERSYKERRFEKVAALIGRSGSFVLGSVKRAAFA